MGGWEVWDINPADIQRHVPDPDGYSAAASLRGTETQACEPLKYIDQRAVQLS